MNKTVDPRIGEEVYHDRIGDGFDLWAVPRSLSRQKAAVLCVDFGSVDVQLSALSTGHTMDLPPGTAHFIEHRLFEKNDGDISDRFNALGGDVNASTSFTATVFSLTCVDNFLANLDLLFELVLDFEISTVGVDRERVVIARELYSGSDDPEWMGFMHGLRGLYGEVPMALDMAGTAETIAAIDIDILRAAYGAFYRPQHMALFLCGDFNYREIADSVEGNLRKYPCGETVWERTPRPFTFPALQTSAGLQLPINRPYSLFFFAEDRAVRTGRELLQRELAFELALDIAFGPASDFFAEQYGEGLNVGDDFGAEVYAEPSFFFCALGGYTEHGKRLAEVVEATLNRIEGQVEGDFRRAKHKAYGQLVRSCEQVEEIADLLCSAVGNGAEPWDYFDVYEDIAVEHVQQALQRCLSVGPMASVHIHPKGLVG